ncbi:unnamed protein product, partial [Linum tenue]
MTIPPVRMKPRESRTHCPNFRTIQRFNLPERSLEQAALLQKRKPAALPL